MEPAATLGIDLSAQPRLTAACLISWQSGKGRVEALVEGANDSVLLDLARRGVVKVGIDAPFGWPRNFVSALETYAQSGRWFAEDRSQLVYRDTDRDVRARTGQVPLSVAADRIAHTAIRCANLLTDLYGAEPVNRTGQGLAAEVYPAAALRQWGMTSNGYKGTGAPQRQTRAALIESLQSATAGWLTIDAQQTEALIRSDHALDSTISAIVAWLVHTGKTIPVPDERREAAAIEGWIHIPQRGDLLTAM